METLREKYGIQSPSYDELEKKFPEWNYWLDRITDLAPLGRLEHWGDSTFGYNQIEKLDQLNLPHINTILNHLKKINPNIKNSETEKLRFPILSLSFGSESPTAPTLLLVGGVHGLERIGSQVVLALLKSFGELLLWDKFLIQSLKDIRVVFVPFLNPIGILKKTRSNPNGVDLMRNSPTVSDETTTFLVGGHRLSPYLPWYKGDHMQPETMALLKLAEKYIHGSPYVLSVDFHSGFGIKDRLWFPYAKTKKPFPHLANMFALNENFDRTFPNHIYQIEPQAKNYTTQGDLWDFLYDEYLKLNTKGVFIPLALEMGSWMWVKKNPRQIFSTLGPFNPMKPHRLKRILRRHLVLFDFLIRSVHSHQLWSLADLNESEKNKRHQQLYDQAISKWYD